jgi:lysophospholipase L1-like esterase
MGIFDKKAYQEHVQEISKRNFEKGKIVLLGDTVIQNLPMDIYLDGEVIYNNTIINDTTLMLEETLYKRAIKYKPSKCFISIGSNDIGLNNDSVKSIYNNIINIIKVLKRRSKETKILIVSAIPVNPCAPQSDDCVHAKNRDNFDIKMLNYYLKNFARKNRFSFVDVAKHLKNDYEQLNLEYTTDGFHLNEFGIDIVKECMKEYV